jgi:hypothetical protein
MFQSALLYLQQDFAKQRYIRSNAMILPHVLSVWQQSTRACQFLQYSFSLLFWPRRTGISADIFDTKKARERQRPGIPQQTEVGRLIQEPGAVATGFKSTAIQRTNAKLWFNHRLFIWSLHPVATATGSVFVDPQ